MKQNTGFSLVELLVASLAAAILALTAGTMLYHAYDAWDDNHAAVNLHRDGQNAIDLLSRAIRVATSADVEITANSIIVSDVSINNLGGAQSVSVTRTGSDLIYDPDTDTADDEVTLIEDAVTSFVVSTNVFGGLDIDLELQSGSESLQLETVVLYRNEI